MVYLIIKNSFPKTVLLFDNILKIVNFQNRLRESLNLFRGICNNRFFREAAMVRGTTL